MAGGSCCNGLGSGLRPRVSSPCRASPSRRGGTRSTPGRSRRSRSGYRTATTAARSMPCPRVWASARCRGAPSRGASSRSRPQQLAERMSQPLGALDLRVVQIDGIHFREHVVLIALGIDAEGQKHVLGLREGTTENATVVRALLARPGRSRALAGSAAAVRDRRRERHCARPSRRSSGARRSCSAARSTSGATSSSTCPSGCGRACARRCSRPMTRRTPRWRSGSSSGSPSRWSAHIPALPRRCAKGSRRR